MNHIPARRSAVVLLGGFILAATAAASDPASPKEEIIKLDAMFVTGTSLKRLALEKVLPISMLDRDFIESRNALTPVELLTALPQITNVPVNETTQGSAQPRGDNANVNLRGIGIANTLVLLNGRRFAPHPVASPEAGTNVLVLATNVNALPTQGLERIDVLRDGASSIYGSDAVAGVINVITNRDFRGTDLRLRIGVPEHGGGESTSATLTHGREFAHGKGRLLLTVEGFKRMEIPNARRSFAATADLTALAPPPFNVDNRSAVSPWPLFRVGTPAGVSTYFRPVNGTPALTNVAPTRAANPEFFVNVNAYQNLGASRSDRQNFFQAFEYDLSPRVTAFADFSYYHASSSLQRQPVAFNAPAAEPLSATFFTTMAANNPFNPYGARFYSPTGAPNTDGTARLTGTPQGLVLVTHLLSDNGPEKMQIASGAYRGVVGLRGKLFDTWNWEAGTLYSRANTSDRSPRSVRLSLLQDALARADNTAYNPFGYSFKVSGNAVVADQPAKNSAAVLDSMVREWRRDGFSSLASVDARAAGPLFTYWGNTVSLAFGAEFRKEESINRWPEYAGLNPPGTLATGKENDFINATAKPNIAGDRTIASGFAEAVIPLVQPRHQLPLLASLEFTASARFERYSDFGSTTRPKVGINWQPAQGLMVRASFNEGFTAPGLPSLYLPAQFTVDAQADAYWGPVTGRGPYTMRSYLAGDRKLKASTARGKSVGVVFEVPMLKGLTITADYWQIDQRNVVGSRTSAQILSSDTALLNAYVQSQLAAGRTAAQIDLGSGTPNYQGDPAVVRLAPSAQDTADFNAYNATRPAASQRPVAGQILSRSAAFENLAKGYGSGVDLSLSYALPKFALGRFRVSTDWAYLASSYQLRSVGGGASPLFIERMNVDGAARWRGTAALTWRQGGWNANASAYYIGSFADPSAATTAANYLNLGAPGYLSKQFDSGTFLYRYVVHDVTTFNASLGYQLSREGPKWLGPATVRIGVVNLTDKPPPFALGTTGTIGYYAAVHSALFAGRTWTLELIRMF